MHTTTEMGIEAGILNRAHQDAIRRWEMGTSISIAVSSGKSKVDDVNGLTFRTSWPSVQEVVRLRT